MTLGRNSRICCPDCKRLNQKDWDSRRNWTEEKKARRYAAYRKWKQSPKGEAWYEENSDRLREQAYSRTLENTYGISRAEYDAMLSDQGGVCALPFCPRSEGLVVDHCHVDGHVRGILCGHHNRAIGMLGDSRDSIAQVLEYLDDTPRKDN